MRKSIVLFAVAAGALATAALSGAAFGHKTSVGTNAAKVIVLNKLWYELVGQYLNSDPGVTPATHFHYGYLSWVQGVSSSEATPRTEKTADFTFFADGKTSPIIKQRPAAVCDAIRDSHDLPRPVAQQRLQPPEHVPGWHTCSCRQVPA